MTNKDNSTYIQRFNTEYPYQVKSGHTLRGGKGIIARTHKTTIFVSSQEAADKAIKQYGKNMVKVEVFKDLNDVA